MWHMVQTGVQQRVPAARLHIHGTAKALSRAASMQYILRYT
jgi:hypothetical protein